MKNVFASLLVLCCLAAPTYAAQGWDGTLPDALVILPPAEVDGDAYNAILKQMAATLSPELGKPGDEMPGSACVGSQSRIGTAAICQSQAPSFQRAGLR